MLELFVDMLRDTEAIWLKYTTVENVETIREFISTWFSDFMANISMILPK